MQVSLLTAVTVSGRQANHLGTKTYSGSWTHKTYNIIRTFFQFKKAETFIADIDLSCSFLPSAVAVLRSAMCHPFLYPEGCYTETKNS